MIAMLQGEKPMDTVAMLAAPGTIFKAWRTAPIVALLRRKLDTWGIQKNGEFHHEKMGRRWVEDGYSPIMS
jgi:GMP synthase-like glutamine amidotransferase